MLCNFCIFPAVRLTSGAEIRLPMDKSIHSPQYQDFLRRLRLAREAAGLSQTQVAERLGEPQSWVSRIETGETRMHVIELLAYFDAIGASAAEFVRELEQFGRAHEE